MYIVAGKQLQLADMAELVDAPDLGSGEVIREGSNPSIRTMACRRTGGCCDRYGAGSVMCNKVGSCTKVFGWRNR